MSKHVHAGGGTRTLGQWARAALAWHDARPRAAVDSVRGWLWIVLVAAVFFWMSNPLVFVPGFHLALPKSTTWTWVVVIVTLPWVRVPRVPWPWLAFLVLAALSAAWTIDPHLTDYTNDLYLRITLVALVMAANCEARVVSWGMGLGGVVVIALSLYAAHENMWRASDLILTEDGGTKKVLLGVGTNDNILAYTLAVALAAMLATGLPRRLPARLAWCAVIGSNAYGLYLAGSGTGFLTVLCIAVAWAAVLAWPTLRRRGRRFLAAVVASGAVVLVGGALLVAVALGKDLATLSGRSPFWRATIEVSLDRAPFLGSGWGAVWPHPWSMVPPNEVADEIFARAGYPLPHGHNFFIDVLPELGLVGVAIAVLMVAYVLREVRRSGLQVGGRDPVMGRLALLVLVALLVSGITEPMLTVPLGWWSLTLVAALSRQVVRVTPEAERPAEDEEPQVPSTVQA